MNKFVGLSGLCLIVLTVWCSWGRDNLTGYASSEVIWTILMGIGLIALHLDLKETVGELNNKLRAPAQRTANIDGRLSIPGLFPNVGADSPLNINEKAVLLLIDCRPVTPQSGSQNRWHWRQMRMSANYSKPVLNSQKKNFSA